MHSDAGRLRYDCFRYRGLPIGSGAIESTIRRVINLRLKRNSIYWTEDNAEAVIQLRATVVSGRWEEIVEHSQATMAKDRRTNWHWTPPECLAELKALEEDSHVGNWWKGVLSPMYVRSLRRRPGGLFICIRVSRWPSGATSVD